MSQKAVTDAVNVGVGMGLGYNQKWVDVTPERQSGVDYINDTGKPIMVSASAHRRDAFVQAKVDGMIIVESADHLASDAPRITATFIVPIGSVYSIRFNRQHNSTMMFWRELR